MPEYIHYREYKKSPSAIPEGPSKHRKIRLFISPEISNQTVGGAVVLEFAVAFQLRQDG